MDAALAPAITDPFQQGIEISAARAMPTERLRLGAGDHRTREWAGQSGEKPMLCPSLSMHQQTSPRQRVELAYGLAARSTESDACSSE